MFDRVREKLAGRLRSLLYPENTRAASAGEPRSTSSPVVAIGTPEVVVNAAAAAKGPLAHGVLGDAKKAAQVYGRATDLWTSRVVDLLKQRGVDCEVVELDDADSAGLDDRLVAETKQQRAPYVFLRGQFVGGFNQLDAIDRVGQLAERVAAPGSAPKNPAMRTKIVLLAGDDETPYGERR